jgi:hypothetical protein
MPKGSRIDWRAEWRAYSDEEKAKQVGDAWPAVDLFLKQLDAGEYSPEEIDELVEVGMNRVTSLSVRIKTAEQHYFQLQRERKALYARLLMAGAAQSSIAKRAGLSPMAVTFSARTAERSGRAR